MAYYIGSNIYEVNEDNIRKIIYVITFGMTLHVVLNFITDIVIKKWIIFYSSTHYDIWTLEKASTTATVTNYIFIIGILFYALFVEKNRTIKPVYLVLFTILMIYEIALGQRTAVLMLAISLFVSIVFYIFNIKKEKVNYSSLLKYILIVILTVVIVFVILRLSDVPFFHVGIKNSRLFSKLFNKGLKTERFDIMINTIELMPTYLFGNCEISNILGIMPHNLWLDIYDWGGIVTFVLISIHTILFIITFVKLCRNKKISNSFKLIVLPLFICIFIEMCLEPIMSGASIFFICVIIVEAIIEKTNIYAK